MRIVVLPGIRPRPSGDMTAARTRAALLTPVTLLADAILQPVIDVAVVGALLGIGSWASYP